MADLDKSYSEVSLNRYKKLLVTTMVFTYLLIVVGGIVRVTGSGLGCPDWPTCFGKWIPPMRADAIIEYIHRLVATLTSPLILASAFIGWWKYRKVKLIKNTLLWAMFLLGVQGLLGGVVVLLETPPDLVAVHMGNALVILGLIILAGMTVDKLITNPQEQPRIAFKADFEKLALWTMIMIFVVLVTGAYTAGSGSTFACSGWPLCNGRLIPTHILGWIHMFHRLLVAITSVWVIRLYLQARKNGDLSKGLNTTILWFVILYLSQAAVGGLKVSLQFPVWLMGTHVALAAAVWFAIVLIASQLGLKSGEGK
ncbi:MAG: heme A synthase [Chloroflexi bacterium]|jgi:heme A synthase|nr:heme A synthase [Chloroflexota bacterium]MBT3668779.1 heme A synthase [Chloroflexota bacterium]MBT4001985.1 heme A synthase [Chloroflexota bacterium]MBT4305480.1 heme A synthase [Chloroflexota bacterium]MBT4533091.1 heme A synthase [Chloroflexota bacterium]